MKIPTEHLRVAKVVGENEEGITLFVPKSLEGEFNLEGGERFLTFIFTRSAGSGSFETWLPWETE